MNRIATTERVPIHLTALRIRSPLARRNRLQLVVRLRLPITKSNPPMELTAPMTIRVTRTTHRPPNWPPPARRDRTVPLKKTPSRRRTLSQPQVPEPTRRTNWRDRRHTIPNPVNWIRNHQTATLQLPSQRKLLKRRQLLKLQAPKTNWTPPKLASPRPIKLTKPNCNPNGSNPKKR